MTRLLVGIVALALGVAPAQAHFIWIVPDRADDAKARVVFSESLEPDEAVAVDKIAATKLFARDGAGKVTTLPWQEGKHAYAVKLPPQQVVGGLCTYGVLQRGQTKPFLLVYCPKLVHTEAQAAKAWAKLPLEIVAKGQGTFQVFFGGKPAPAAQVVVLAPGSADQTLTADAAGTFKIALAAPGLYGIRARHVAAQAGELGGKKYEEVRHYATLVFPIPFAKAALAPRTAAAPPAAWAPLPRAVSSFGAAVADGWLYVYGGHCARTHQYATDAVLGTFQRLKLADPKEWQPLPSGPPAQGLALVAHAGLLYRIGGMQPRNRPGDKADNHSLASCARFDPARGLWTALPDLPAGRSSHDAVVVGNKLVVVGGWDLHGAGKEPDWHRTMLVLDLKQPRPAWQAVKQPFQRRALTAAAFDGKVYVLGGMSDDLKIQLTVNIYDPARDVWTTGPELPGPRRNGFAPAACVAADRLYVSTGDGKLLRLTPQRDAWQPVGALQQPRIVHRLVARHDGLLLAVGGAAKGSNVALTEAIRP